VTSGVHAGAGAEGEAHRVPDDDEQDPRHGDHHRVRAGYGEPTTACVVVNTEGRGWSSKADDPKRAGRAGRAV